MTNDDLDNELYVVSKAECLQCGKEWISVHPLAADNLECPQCHSTDTVREDA